MVNPSSPILASEETFCDPCPVHCLGLERQACVLISPVGRRLVVEPEELASRGILNLIFEGQLSWLLRNFPERYEVVANLTGGGRKVPVGLDAGAAAVWLAQACDNAEARAALARHRAAQRGWLSRLIERVRFTERAT